MSPWARWAARGLKAPEARASVLDAVLAELPAPDGPVSEPYLRPQPVSRVTGCPSSTCDKPRPSRCAFSKTSRNFCKTLAAAAASSKEITPSATLAAMAAKAGAISSAHGLDRRDLPKAIRRIGNRPTRPQPIWDPNPISKTRSGSSQRAGGEQCTPVPGESASWAHDGQSPIAHISR